MMTAYQEKVDRFRDLLRRASAKVPREYFLLPVAANEGNYVSMYRERVYCYELYHQLRSIWPDYYECSLAGEVDKSGNPLLPFRKGNSLYKVKPDFIVHVPGSMENNLIVIEVKPVTAGKGAIGKDLKHLAGFVQTARYEYAVYLVFGEGEQLLKTFKDRACACAASQGIDLDAIELWWHSKAGKEAIRAPWRNA